MTWQGWTSILIMAMSVFAMARGLAGPDLVLAAARSLLPGFVTVFYADVLSVR